MKIKERDKKEDKLAHENLLCSSDQNAFFNPPSVVLDENDFESMHISEGNFLSQMLYGRLVCKNRLFHAHLLERWII